MEKALALALYSQRYGRAMCRFSGGFCWGRPNDSPGMACRRGWPRVARKSVKWRSFLREGVGPGTITRAFWCSGDRTRGPAAEKRPVIASAAPGGTITRNVLAAVYQNGASSCREGTSSAMLSAVGLAAGSEGTITRNVLAAGYQNGLMPCQGRTRTGAFPAVAPWENSKTRCGAARKKRRLFALCEFNHAGYEKRGCDNSQPRLVCVDGKPCCPSVSNESKVPGTFDSFCVSRVRARCG